MRVPRNWSGRDTCRKLEKLGYRLTRQVGSHMRLTSFQSGVEHHVTVPDHTPVRVGTLTTILRGVQENFAIDRDELLRLLDL